MGPIELPVQRHLLLNPVPPEDVSTDDMLEAFAPRVRELLEGFRDRRRLSAIARDLGFNVSRLTEMISRDENGEYRRKVTPYYLIKFIEGGIMSVEEILDGRPLETLQERVRIFFERMVLSRRTIRLVYQAQKRGIDEDRLLETILEARQP